MYLMDEVAHGKWQNKKTYTAISIAILTFVLAVLLMFVTPVFATTANGFATKVETTLPSGEEFNSFLKNTPLIDEDGNPVVDENGKAQTVDNSKKIKTITFDYFTSGNSYVVDGVNVIDGVEATTISKDVYLYRVELPNEMQNLYILSANEIFTDKDSSCLFKDLTALEEVYFNNFNTANAVSMRSMFDRCFNLSDIDLSCFNTANVEDMSYMFYETGVFLLDLSSFNTVNLKTMRSMFEGCDAEEIDMSSFDTHNVDNMTKVFANLQAYTIYASNNWVLPNNNTCKDMFYTCRLLTGTFGTCWRRGENDYQLNISEINARLDLPGAPGYFCDVSQKLPIDIPNGETMNKIIKGYKSGDSRKVTSITFDYYTEDNTYVVDGVNIIEGIEPEKISKTVNLYRVGSGEDMCDVYILSNDTIHASRNVFEMFRNEMENPTPEGGPFYYLTKIAFKNFDTSATYDMDAMFFFCLNVTDLDLSGFNTSRVRSMENMFFGCYSLVNLNISSFNTSNVKTMRQMFSGCYNLKTLDLSHFNTSNVTDMYLMFDNCYDLEELNVSNFNTYNVTSMWSMFRSCYSLTELDLTSFSLNGVQGVNLDSMFNSCGAKTVYVSDVRFYTQAQSHQSKFNFSKI